jgi:hypothetical protein
MKTTDSGLMVILEEWFVIHTIMLLNFHVTCFPILFIYNVYTMHQEAIVINERHIVYDAHELLIANRASGRLRLVSIAQRKLGLRTAAVYTASDAPLFSLMKPSLSH